LEILTDYQQKPSFRKMMLSQEKLLGKGSYGKVTVCPGGACKSFKLTGVFFRESALSIYLSGLPGLVVVKEINCPNMMIVMERYEKNLHQWNKEHRGPDKEKYDVQRITFLQYILYGINSLHQLGLVHGDLKPLNILVRGEEAVLADFGNTGSPAYTLLELITPPYSPPDNKATLSADIYALGIIILEMWDPLRSCDPMDYPKLNLKIKLAKMPDKMKEIASWCTRPDSAARPRASDIYHYLTKEKISCTLPNVTIKPTISEVEIDDLCETLSAMRVATDKVQSVSPERTLGFFNYWVKTRKIDPKDYMDYALAIIYLHDQINNLGQPLKIRNVFKNEKAVQMSAKLKVCELLEEKRGLQFLILGY
jgi:serine/threonine protein kinase